MNIPTTAEVVKRLRDGQAPPVSAMRVFGSTVELAQEGNSDAAKSIKVKLKARQRDAIFHPYWGKVYHDLSTMRSRPKIALDDTHDVEVGHGRPVMSEYGLEVEGVVITNPDMPDHPANRIAYNLRNGIPQEASIDFGGDYDVVEIPSGATMALNGLDASGPALVVQNWPLRACAICKEGADASTETNALANTGSAAAPLPRSITTFSQPKGNPMVKCSACSKEFDYAAQPEIAMGAVACPHCGAHVNQEGQKLSQTATTSAPAIVVEAIPAEPVTETKPAVPTEAAPVALAVEAAPVVQPETPNPVDALQAVAVELEQVKAELDAVVEEKLTLMAEIVQLEERIEVLTKGVPPVPPTETAPAKLSFKEAHAELARLQKVDFAQAREFYLKHKNDLKL